MTEVRISPKYQAVIPKPVREAFELKPGQMVQVIARAGRIEMIPVRPIGEMRGFLGGHATFTYTISDGHGGDNTAAVVIGLPDSGTMPEVAPPPGGDR